MIVIIYLVSFLLFIIAYSNNLVGLVALNEAFFGIAILYYEFRKKNNKLISPITLFALKSAITGTGNFLGYQDWLDKSNYSEYLIYAKPEYFLDSNAISLIGSMLIIMGWLFAEKNNFNLSMVHLQVKPQRLANFLAFSAVFIRLLILLNAIPGWGAISSLITLLPLYAIYYFSRRGSNENNSYFIFIALLLTSMEVVYGLFYEYLRFLIIRPLISYIIGFYIGSGSVKRWGAPSLIGVYIIIIFLIPYFSIFGNERQNLGVGYNRIEKINKLKDDQNQDSDVINPLLSRQSNFNQITNIVYLTKENGFYNGKTLEYFSYVFIPRFLWKDKPSIAQGAWFAFEIGQGRLLDDRLTNSINMTIPGELYLNYSWIGVAIGSFIVGVLFLMIWNSTQFWESKNNFTGGLLGFYLLFLGFGSIGPDLQIVVTLIAAYLSLFVVSRVLKLIS